jgi:hypothetical protein
MRISYAALGADRSPNGCAQMAHQRWHARPRVFFIAPNYTHRRFACVRYFPK